MRSQKEGFGLLHKLYEKRLLNKIQQGQQNPPSSLAIVLPETDLLQKNSSQKTLQFITWCQEFDIKKIYFNVDILDEKADLKNKMIYRLVQLIERICTKLPPETGYDVYGEDGSTLLTQPGNGPSIIFVLGYGGKKEITSSVRTILCDVEKGNIEPEDIDENILESHLTIEGEPDLIIRSGGRHLSDFLIWQSVYSELYFTDVNWNRFRRIDFLRIIRDFQKRKRRYGK